MADINKLKDKIKSTIYPNGKGAINASDHQAMLLDMADGMAETDTKLAELSEEIDNLLGGDTPIELPSYILGEYWKENGANISYGGTPKPCRYEPIDVSKYIGKTANITITWYGVAEPSSWIYLCFFKPSTTPNSDATGIVKEVDCYNAATNGVYSFDIEISNNYLFLSKRNESTDINIKVAVGNGIIAEIEQKAEDAYKAAPKTSYVATNGSDANDGKSAESAYATIQMAIDKGANIIYVEPGQYAQPITIRGKDSISILPLGYGEYSHSVPNTPKIVIDGNNTREYGILAHDCRQLRMIGVEFANFTRSVAQIKNVDDLYFLDCIVRDNELYNGFQLTNVNGVLENCSAINIYDDGFNIHGYGCTHFINCTALNCHDDGISHHDGCTGFIEGGEYSRSGKAGIAPAYGANVNIANVVCKNNVIGIGYLTTENGHARMKGIVSNALLVGNTTGLKVDELCDVIAYNNKYKDNGQDKQFVGNVEDYDL